MIADIIKLVQSNPFYGAGKFTEIAKGQNEIDNYFRKTDASANNANDTILKLSDSYKSLSTIKEENLNIIGAKFKDASIFFNDASEINTDDLIRWIKKSRAIQWDYKNIVKRKGVLERLK